MDYSSFDASDWFWHSQFGFRHDRILRLRNLRLPMPPGRHPEPKRGISPKLLALREPGFDDRLS